MRTPRAGQNTAYLKLAGVLLGLNAADVSAAPDFSGVWGMVQHDRLGAPFFIPIEPKLNAAGHAPPRRSSRNTTSRISKQTARASSPACRL